MRSTLTSIGKEQMFFVQLKQIRWKVKVPTTRTPEVVFHISGRKLMLSEISLAQITGATVSHICHE